MKHLQYPTTCQFQMVSNCNPGAGHRSTNSLRMAWQVDCVPANLQRRRYSAPHNPGDLRHHGTEPQRSSVRRVSKLLTKGIKGDLLTGLIQCMFVNCILLLSKACHSSPENLWFDITFIYIQYHSIVPTSRSWMHHRNSHRIGWMLPKAKPDPPGLAESPALDLA